MWQGRLRVGALSALLLAIVLAACGGTRQTPDRVTGQASLSGGTTESVSGEAEPADEVVDLEGTDWILTALRDSDLLAGTNITLGFAGGQVSGFAGCNAYGAPYTTDGNRLAIEVLEMTAQDCLEPEGVMEQEAAYAEALWQVRAYRVLDNRLELEDEAGEPILVFEREVQFAMDPADLVGTAWRLVSTDGQPPVEGSFITLTFQDTGHASGHAGCREYTATYTASGDDIQFPFLSMSGDETCLEQDALYRQEGDYTDALTWAANYRLSDEQLEIRTARGEELIFEPLAGDSGLSFDAAGGDFPPTGYRCSSPFYMAWASHRLEGLTEQLQGALDAAGLVGVEGYAEAFGENWYEYDQETGQAPTVCNFSIMETDFYVTLPVENLADTEALGAQVGTVLGVLDTFPPEETPGSQAGIVDIVLASGGEERHLHFSIAEAAEARAAGLEGDAMMQALGYRTDPCHNYLDLLVYADGAQEQAVVTSYRCQELHVDSTGNSPASTPSLAIPAGEPLRFYLGAQEPPQSVEVRLYPQAGLSASFFRWPEELPTGVEPVEQLQPGPTASFQYLPQVPPGDYSVVVRATWDQNVELFYALSIRLE
jgi:heat shock protein HslJ